MFFTKCISCQSKNRFVKNNMCMLTFFNIGSDLSISDLQWEMSGKRWSGQFEVSGYK